MSSAKPSESPRIAIFLPSLNGGGAERVAVTLGNAFAARGYSVDLVVAKAQGPFMSQVSSAVRVVDLNAGLVLKAIWPLARYLRRERPQAMLSAMTHANLAALIARMLAGVSMRLVVSERSTISVEVSRASGWGARILYALVPRLYPLADGIVVVSKSAADDLTRFANLPEAAVSVIYNPFDLDRIEKLAGEPLPHPWFAPDEPPVILAIGRLTEQKDFSSLIRAFVRVRAKRPARLMILGEGELRRALAALVNELGLTAEDIAMPGFARDPYAYFARAALFVLSSRWEGLSGVLIEALDCGVPVVATDCPSGPCEILEDGRWGGAGAGGGMWRRWPKR